MTKAEINKVLDKLLAITNLAILVAFAAVLFGDSYFWAVMAAIVKGD